MIKSLDKGLRVLSCLAAKPGAGPSEISRELKYGKSNVVRLLQTMKASGYVRQDPDSGRYEMGAKALELAHCFLMQQDDIVALATDQIQALWSNYRETVGLYVRQGDVRVCIYRLESPHGLRHTVMLGAVRPLYVGASGKAFLAYMRPEEVEALLVRENVDSAHASELRRQLSEIRQRGVAFGLGEREAGRVAVATPILNRRREPTAVIFVSGPVQRLPSDRLPEIAEALAAAAQTIASRLVG